MLLENKDFQTCEYLADGAIYQAGKPAGIWGTAIDGTVITAQLYQDSDIIVENNVIASGGRWSLELPSQKAGYTAYTIKLCVNNKEIAEYSDILFGEVWIAAGQSNMQLKLYDSYGGVDSMKKADDAYLRVYQAVSRPDLGTGLSAPAADISGQWVKGDTSHVGVVSAVAYHFALKLREELDVPIAVLETSLGSTPIEAWLSKEMLDEHAELRSKAEKLGVYKTEALAHADMGAMYYSKIAPLSHTSIAGVIWYQGESNVKRASLYDEQLGLLKEKWGQAFGFEKDSMPFIFTQLAPYSFSTSDNQMLLTGMMDQMTLFYKEHESSAGMVTNYDLSLRYMDTLPTTVQAVIHPTVKQPIGERMALSALGLVYGGKEATAPILSSCELVDGVAVLTFSHVGDGLKLTNESLGALGFALCDENGTWVNATAEIINSNTVFVYSNMMQNPVHVSYAYCDMNTDANLCASNGIPAAPFFTGGKGGLGSRSYLNCDGELFVTTSLETRKNAVGHGEYQNLWILTNRSKISFDSTYCAQGTASVKVNYEAGKDEVIAGLDLQESSKYSTTVGLEKIKRLSVKMSNADKREKSIRLAVKSQDGTILLSEPQTLEADADFATLVFDFEFWYRENGVQEPYPQKMISDMVGFGFYIDDPQAGTVWIDDIKLGLDEYWEPDIEAVMAKLGLEREYVSEVRKDVRETTSTLPIELIAGIGIAVVVVVIAIIFGTKIRNKKAVKKGETEHETK